MDNFREMATGKQKEILHNFSDAIVDSLLQEIESCEEFVKADMCFNILLCSMAKLLSQLDPCNKEQEDKLLIAGKESIRKGCYLARIGIKWPD